LYWPIVSIVRPSRGERRSATTMRQIGFLLDPTRLNLILTIGCGRLAGPLRNGSAEPLRYCYSRERVAREARSGFLCSSISQILDTSVSPPEMPGSVAMQELLQ
jgi:hypothetical protein